MSHQNEMSEKKLRKITIPLNVLYAGKKICLAYVSKHNSDREKQVILLMISNGKGRKAVPERQCHYLALKNY